MAHKSVLVREKISSKKEPIFSEELIELAAKSYLVLGYRYLQAVVSKHKTVSLLSVLKELDISPYSEKSVKKYKAKMLSEFSKTLKVQPINEDDDEDSSDDEGPVRVRIPKWRKMQLCDYNKPIPEFVLSKAIAIAEKLPEVNLTVEELTTESPDPFLIASHRGITCYIEVWDEPEFESNVLNSITGTTDDDDYDDEE